MRFHCLLSAVAAFAIGGVFGASGAGAEPRVDSGAPMAAVASVEYQKGYLDGYIAGTGSRSGQTRSRRWSGAYPDQGQRPYWRSRPPWNYRNDLRRPFAERRLYPDGYGSRFDRRYNSPGANPRTWRGRGGWVNAHLE
jgi:hypothetical protein